VQEGGAMKFKATEEPPAGLLVPRVRAHGTGTTHAHVTWLVPSEGTTRLLTTLTTRGGPRVTLRTAQQRLLDLAMTHAGFVNPL